MVIFPGPVRLVRLSNFTGILCRGPEDGPESFMFIWLNQKQTSPLVLGGSPIVRFVSETVVNFLPSAAAEKGQPLDGQDLAYQRYVTGLQVGQPFSTVRGFGGGESAPFVL